MVFRNSMNFISEVSFFLGIFFYFSNNIASSLENLPSNTTVDPICKNAICGQGTCEPSSSSILGFACKCNDGWKKFPDGPSFPCLIPNCSFGLQCGSTTPSPPLNFTSPCSLVWCNKGVCVANGTGHFCRCNAGSENLSHNPAFPCISQCVLGLGANCKKVEPPSPSPTNSVPLKSGEVPDQSRSTASDSGLNNTVTGSKNGANCLWKVQAFIILLPSIFLTWM